MTIWQSIILGFVQGLTEFLPVSSSGHLVIIPFLFGWRLPANEAFIFDVLVQVATLAGVFAYFWKDLQSIGSAWFQGILHQKPFASQNARLGWYLILATIPAGVIGLALEDHIANAFNSALAAAIFLFGTAGLLLIAELLGKRERDLTSMNWLDALLIGFSQVLAIFPGISRSGATITGGMSRGLDRSQAARFSFLLSAPIMLAAGALATFKLLQTPNLGQLLPTFLPGFFVAGVSGYLSISWLLKYLIQHRLYIFALYCAALASVTIVFLYLR